MARCDICGAKIGDKEGSTVFMQYGINPKVLCSHCSSLLSDKKSSKYKSFKKSHIESRILFPKVIAATITLLCLLSLFSMLFIKMNITLSKIQMMGLIATTFMLILFIVWAWVIFFFSRRIMK